MAVEDVLISFGKVSKQLGKKSRTYISAAEDKNLVKATVETWFRTYRPSIVGVLGDNATIQEIDDKNQQLLKFTFKVSKKSDYKETINTIINLLKTGILVELKVKEWIGSKQSSLETENQKVIKQLEKEDAHIASGYRQVLMDLGDSERISFKGTANELREVIREILDKLAPDNAVSDKRWFKDRRLSAEKEEDKKRTPTMTEKTRYIMEKKAKGSKEIETAQDAINDIDTRLGNLVRSLYSRASVATHVQKSRQEIVRILSYVNPVLLELTE